MIAEATSIPTVFAVNGSMLLVVGVLMTVPLNRRAKADTLID